MNMTLGNKPVPQPLDYSGLSGRLPMKLTKTLLATTALTVAAGMVSADGHMSSEMTIVSWGGAYSASQKGAYHDPYAAANGVTIINDDSSAEAVAKLRAMNEAGNMTWDVVDVEAGPAMQLCDEGLAMEIDQISCWPTHQTELLLQMTSVISSYQTALFHKSFIQRHLATARSSWQTAPNKLFVTVFDTETYPGKRS